MRRCQHYALISLALVLLLTNQHADAQFSDWFRDSEPDLLDVEVVAPQPTCDAGLECTCALPSRTGCRPNINLILLLDASWCVLNEWAFVNKYSKTFTRITDDTVGVNTTFGISEFGNDGNFTHKPLPLEEFNKNHALESLKSLKYYGEHPYLNQALLNAKEDFLRLTEERGTNPSYLVIVTDGNSHKSVTSDMVREAVNQLHAINVTILPVAITHKPNGTIFNILNEQYDEFFYLAMKPGKKSIANIMYLFKENGCELQSGPACDCNVNCCDCPLGPPGSKGPKGEKGDTGKGKKGPEGEPGPPGKQGKTGNKGYPGLKGEKGNDGLAGLKGTDGPPGPQGLVGPRGDKGHGKKGPEGTQGEKGDPGETKPCNCKGTGDRGDPGLPGTKGVGGPEGSTGAKGKSGDSGPKGELGPKGSKGERGWPGLDGQNGMRGPPGIDGLKGVKGFPGSKGYEGRIGVNGPQGVYGKEGGVGPKGCQGIEGDVGPIGPHSTVFGPAGPKGYPGDMGEPGISGRPGIRGPAGPPGAKGPRGSQGQKGDIDMSIDQLKQRIRQIIIKAGLEFPKDAPAGSTCCCGSLPTEPIPEPTTLEPTPPPLSVTTTRPSRGDSYRWWSR